MELGSEIKSRAAAALPELAEEIGGAAGAIGFDLSAAERCDGAIFLVGDGERRQLLLIADIGGRTESGNKSEIYNKAGSDSEPTSGGSAAQYGSAVGDTSRIDVERGTVFTCRDDVGSVCLEYKDSNGEHLLCRADMSYAKLYAGAALRLGIWADGGIYDDSYEQRSRKVCPKCGMPYKQGSSVCPRCAEKGKYFRRLWREARSSHFIIYISVLLYLVSAAFDIVSPIFTRVLTDDYINADDMPPISGFLVTVAMMFGVGVLSRIVTVVRSVLLARAGNRVTVDLRNLIFSRIMKLSIGDIGRRKVGYLMRRVSSDTAVLKNFLVNDIGQAIEMAVMFIGVGIFLFSYSPAIALAILLPMPLIYMLNHRFNRFIWPRFLRSWIASANASTVMHDIFSGIRVVKSYGRERAESVRYERYVAKERDMKLITDRWYSVVMPILQFLMGAGQFFILWYMGRGILRGDMTLGYMQQISSYITMLYSPLFWFSSFLRKLVNVSVSVVRIYEIVDEEGDMKESEHPVERNITGEISVNNISFGYEHGDVLRGVSLDIMPGETIGIVGRSGVGKTTLINLIMRMYDVSDGSIRIDGVDIRDYSGRCLRSQIGAVLQETFLFGGTVYENIAYAKPDATRREVITAAKLAGAHNFIMRMSDGYNTRIGEGGMTVSGGERQRISIARALLHDPRILILDEATSALDIETEREIQRSLAYLSKGRTTIAIAHRLSTLRNATRLVVLDKGGVAEVGTHEELMKKHGIYYGLVCAQRDMNRISKQTEGAGGNE